MRKKFMRKPSFPRRDGLALRLVYHATGAGQRHRVHGVPLRHPDDKARRRSSCLQHDGETLTLDLLRAPDGRRSSRPAAFTVTPTRRGSSI